MGETNQYQHLRYLRFLLFNFSLFPPHHLHLVNPV